MKKLIAILILVPVAGGAGWYYWHANVASKPEFRTLPVMRGEMFVGVTATGTMEPVELVDVGAQIVASIKSFGPDPDRPGKTIDFDSRVKKDAVLAQLDDLSHRAELEKARANQRLAEAELNNCRARKKQTDQAFRRAKELRGNIAEAEYEKAQAADEMAKAEVEMAEAKVEQAKIAVKQADINLGYTVIRSPIDGVVIARRVNVGQTVVAGMNAPTLFLLAKDLRHMTACAAVNEADIGDIHVGQTVTFTVDAHRNRTFTGKVSQIRNDASLQASVVTYNVIVEVENTDGKLRPYMTPKLQFEVARRRDAVLVPNQALRWRPTWSQVSPAAEKDLATAADAEPRPDDPGDAAGENAEPKVDYGSPVLWVVADDGLVRPVPVTVGLNDGMATEVLSGEIAPGDAVVVGAVPKSMPDFVTSFVSQVTEEKK